MLWNLFAMVLLSSSFFLVVICLSFLLLKGLRFQQQRRLLRFQYAGLFSLIIFGAALVVFSESEFASRCFEQLTQHTPSLSLTKWIASLWITGFFTLLIIDAVRVRSLSNQLNTLLPMQDPRVQNILEELKTALSLSAPLQVLQTSKPVSPFVTGIFRPKLVLPQDLVNSVSDDTLKSLLAHELVHLKERDNVWLIMDLLMRRILFFHPLIFFASNSYRSCVEKAADEQSLLSTGLSTKVFADALIQVADFCRTTKQTHYVLGMSREFKQLRSRIESLYRKSETVSTSRKAFFILISTFAWGISIAQAEITLHARRLTSNGGLMCTQAQHERMIESLFKNPIEQNKCETNSQENLCKF